MPREAERFKPDRYSIWVGTWDVMQCNFCTFMNICCSFSVSLTCVCKRLSWKLKKMARIRPYRKQTRLSVHVHAGLISVLFPTFCKEYRTKPLVHTCYCIVSALNLITCYCTYVLLYRPSRLSLLRWSLSQKTQHGTANHLRDSKRSHSCAVVTLTLRVHGVKTVNTFPKRSRSQSKAQSTLMSHSWPFVVCSRCLYISLSTCLSLSHRIIISTRMYLSLL